MLYTISDVYGETNTKLDLAQISADDGLKQWIEIQKEIVGPMYFQYFDEVKFALTPDDGKPLAQLVNGKEMDLIESTLQYSPERDRSVNMFVHNIEIHNTGWVPHRLSPDKHVYLFDEKSSRGWAILDIGSSGKLYSVGWVDNNTCVAFGLIPDVRTARLNAWRITVDFPNIRRERFLGPQVNDYQSTALDKKWQSWLKYRFSTITWWNE